MSAMLAEKESADTEVVQAEANGFHNGVRVYRWTVEAYHRANELGFLPLEEHLELIEGEVIEKMGEDPSHSTGVGLLQDFLARTFSLSHHCIRVQHPITLDTSEPEPDVVVALGTRRDYTQRHPLPAEILLVVEVSNTTLLYDRRTKADIYAAAGIAEYWILNLTDRRLEVHRLPLNGIYQQITSLAETQTVSPLAANAANITVRDLLP